MLNERGAQAAARPKPLLPQSEPHLRPLLGFGRNRLQCESFFFQLTNQGLKFFLSNGSYHPEIHATVIVDDAVAQAGNMMEWNLGKLRPCSRGDVPGGSADYGQTHSDGIAGLLVIPELLEAHPSDIARSLLGRFQHLVQVGILVLRRLRLHRPSCGHAESSPYDRDWSSPQRPPPVADQTRRRVSASFPFPC